MPLWTLILFALSLLTLLYVLLFYLQRYIREYQKKKSPKKRFQIAILAHTTTKLPLSLFSQGFISYLKKYAAFEFELIECGASSTLSGYNKWAKYIIEQKPNLVLTVGKKATEHMYTALRTSKTRIPILSAGIPEESIEIPFEEMKKSLPITGIITSLDWNKKISLLKKIIPHLKNVVVLYHSVEQLSHLNLREKNLISAALRHQHINGIMHHIDNIEKSCDLPFELIQNVDLVLISRSSNLMPHTDKISKVCEQYSVPLFSPASASLAYVNISISSDVEQHIGELAGRKAVKILEDGVSAKNLPIEKVTAPQTIYINLEKNPQKLDMKKVVARSVQQTPHTTIILKG